MRPLSSKVLTPIELPLLGTSVPVPKTADPVRIKRVPLVDVAYAHLLDQIGTGQLPAGAAINDRTIAQEVGASPATVRIAIARLAALGLVEMAPNRYTRVAHASRERFMDSVQVAVALWQCGGALFITRADARAFDAFHAEVVKIAEAIGDIRDGDAFIATVLDTLDLLIIHSGNSILVDHAARLRPIISHTARLGTDAYDLAGTARLLQQVDVALQLRNPEQLGEALSTISAMSQEFLARQDTLSALESDNNSSSFD